MFVNCITINTSQRPKNVLFKSSPKELPEIMYKEVGNNIPKCLEYKGGMDLSYTFCIDEKVDINIICKKYKYDIGDTLYKMEIDASTTPIIIIFYYI